MYSESPNGELINKNSVVTVKPTFKAGPPSGLETYMLFASLRPDVDYRVLESMGSKSGNGKSAFDMLLSDYSNADSRNPGTIADLNLNEWATLSMDTVIIK